MIDLTGKSILVTGAASGIGAAAVRMMAGAGARVAGFDLAPSDAELPITGDVTRRGDLEAAVARGRGAVRRPRRVRLQRGAVPGRRRRRAVAAPGRGRVAADARREPEVGLPRRQVRDPGPAAAGRRRRS